MKIHTCRGQRPLGGLGGWDAHRLLRGFTTHVKVSYEGTMAHTVDG